eukprot:6250758-Prymnesium_polylepis.1
MQSESAAHVPNMCREQNGMADFGVFESPPGGHFCREYRRLRPAMGMNSISALSQPQVISWLRQRFHPYAYV